MSAIGYRCDGYYVPIPELDAYMSAREVRHDQVWSWAKLAHRFRFSYKGPRGGRRKS